MVNDIMLSAMAWATSLRTIAVQRLKEERGQDLLEYAVLAGAITVAAAAVLFAGGAGWLNFGTFTSKIQNCISFSNTCGK